MLSSDPAVCLAFRRPVSISSQRPRIFQKRCPRSATGRLGNRCTSSRLSRCPSKRASITRPLSAPRSTAAILRVATSLPPLLVRLHLTFEGLMCLLSLWGRQEHCPFTTRLRVLKLASADTPPPHPHQR